MTAYHEGNFQGMPLNDLIYMYKHMKFAALKKDFCNLSSYTLPTWSL